MKAGFLANKASTGRRGNLQVTNVATPSKPPTNRPPKRSKVEIIKEKSDYLRHPLMEELVTPETFISEDAVQLMKFHGSYMQDNREKRAFGAGKFYQFMMRTRQPAGRVTPQLYLTMDDLADQFGNGTLRLTTRQAYQLHGVLKQDLKTVFSSVIKSMGSTLGACGDVNRNVLGPAAPFKNKPGYVKAAQLADDIAMLLAPQSGAYYDVWLDGEKFMSMEMENPEVTAARNFNQFGTNFENSPEPIYGSQFLPRKFKVAVTVPGDNSVDLFTNDLGLVVITDEATGEYLGCNIVVGGGMGRTHRNDETFPYLAEPLGFVPKEDVLHAVKAVVACQRDYGRRDDRRQARLKYLVHSWGIDKFRSVTEQYLGKKFEPFKPLPKWEFMDYLGWHEQGDGKLFYGVFVQNGRIKGEAKKALRKVIERYEIPVVLTPNQNIILAEIDPSWKNDIEASLKAAGLKGVDEIDPIDRLAMACPALPLCGLAVTEAERSLPDINRRIRSLLVRVGLPQDAFHVRMTGCPNGCARPYMAEIGFVGDGPNSYQIWLGGSSNQTRLAEVYAERVKVQDIEKVLEPVLVMYKNRRVNATEGLGDFLARVSLKSVKEYATSYVPGDEAALKQVGIGADLYALLEAKAQKEGKTLAHVASEVLRKSL